MDFKELAFKELEKLVWFLLLLFGFKSPEGDLKPNIFCGGAPPPHTLQNVGLRPPASMSGKVGAICRPPASGGKLHLPHFTMDWAFPFNGRSEGDYSEETIRGDYSKAWRTRYFWSGAHDMCGVAAHTIFFGVALCQ